MHHNRRFTRIRPTGRLSRAGAIVIDAKSPVIDCGIVDYSAGGACLEIIPPRSLPQRFDLIYGSTKKKCRVVWASGTRVGVSF